MDIRYPIGQFAWSGSQTKQQRTAAVNDIAFLPQNMRSAVASLADKQLDTPYREGGWTIRQVVHHVPDSHMNSYIRCKLALTENNPTIKPYDEVAWANLIDGRTAPIEPSLNLLEGLHDRWVRVLQTVSDTDALRTLYHPERGDMTLDHYIALCAWHGKHHVAHITSLRQRLGW
jgi:uncharacterized damage-inducible protein DinB